jgi:hypothetical protein
MAMAGWARALSAGAAAVLMAGATPVIAAEAQLSYVGYLGGAPVLTLNSTISVPAGVKPGDGAYSIAAEIATSGNLAMLYPFSQSLQAAGALKGDAAKPARYQSTMRILSKQEQVTLTYAPNGAVGIAAVPLTRQAQQAQQQGYAHGTIDPASLVIAIATTFAKSGSCDGVHQVFDGARRYDLTLKQSAYADLDAMPNSYYVGSATECTATPELVAGFQQSALNASLYPQAATLWLAPALQDFPAVPVRILAQSAFGEMTLELVNVTQN